MENEALWRPCARVFSICVFVQSCHCSPVLALSFRLMLLYPHEQSEGGEVIFSSEQSAREELRRGGQLRFSLLPQIGRAHV